MNSTLLNIANDIKANAVTHTGINDGNDIVIDDEQISLVAATPIELAEELRDFLPTYDDRLNENRLGLVFYRHVFMIEYLSDEGEYALDIDRERLDGFMKLL